jgi:hypothetical protein
MEFEEVYKEHMEMISKAIENLASRISVVEGALGKMPPPGAEMIKYKPEGYEDYLNIRELFDDLYMRINMIEDRIKVLEP